MVIKGCHEKGKNLHTAAGFMLLETVILIGFVVLIASVATMMHGLIMSSYRDTDNHMHALLYADNALASALTGVSYTIPNTSFKSEVTTTRDVLFAPSNKPCTTSTVTVTWRAAGREYTVTLTRCVADKQVVAV